MKNTNNNKGINNKTSWGGVAEKYNEYINNDKNYHNEIIIPNILRLIGNIKNKNILDIACGQGVLSQILSDNGAIVSGFDAGIELIEIAKHNDKKNKINYSVADAEDFAKNYLVENNINNKSSNKTDKYKDFDIIICVLAIQNIENMKRVIENILLVSNNKTKIYFVINHPAFRIPRASSWGYETVEGGANIQYRRIDKYMSEDKIKMDMNPGEKDNKNKKFTYSFHRPLQYYFKLFSNTGLSVLRLEEWISPRNSVGKNSERENIARKEFPLFMCIEVGR